MVERKYVLILRIVDGLGYETALVAGINRTNFTRQHTSDKSATCEACRD